MKVLLIKDVYKLGRAGDIKKVADGYGRNYLIPMGFAVMATPGALKKVELIRSKATERRAVLNKELGSVAEVLEKVTLGFNMKAGETGKLYGAVTTQMIAEAIKAKYDLDVDRHQIESEPIRTLGEFTAPVHLTVDLVPSIKIIIKREGELFEDAAPAAAEKVAEVVAPVEEEPVAEEATTETSATEAE